jgi:hypothetical protein
VNEIWRDTRLRQLLIISLALVLLVFLHVKGMNGPPYFPWTWQRLNPARSFALTLAAAVPLFLAQYLYSRQPRRLRVALLLVALSTFSLEIACAGLSVSPFSLRRISAVVESVPTTSYFTIAASLSEGPRAHPLRQWLHDYPSLLPTFPGHGATKPPGPVLFYFVMIALFGPNSTASLVGGMIVGVLAALGVPLTFVLIRHLLGNTDAAFHGASFFALSPGLVGFFPQFDQIYPLFTCGLVLFWSLALMAQKPLYAVSFAMVLSVAMFWSYSLLVLGVFLGGYSIIALRAHAGLIRHAAVCAVVGLLTIGVIYSLLWYLTGFDPIATFRVALSDQSRYLRELARRYPRTVPWDVFDFGLGTGWISFLLTGLAFSRALRQEPPGRDLYLILAVVIQIAAVAVTGLLQTETARVWLFMAPLLMIPVGLELKQWRIHHLLTLYGCLWLILTAVHQNMDFFGVQ